MRKLAPDYHRLIRYGFSMADRISFMTQGLFSPRVFGPVLGAAVLLAGGCVQRTISITSEPSGALVWLNDEEVGRTPIAVPFTFYGTYDVRLEKDGFASLWTVGEAKQPWWELPGPDLVAELIPGAESNVAWHYELSPATPNEAIDTAALRERALELRDQTRRFEMDQR